MAGLFDLAIGHLQEAVRAQPTSYAAHANLAVALEGKGQLHEALASHQAALRHGEHTRDAPDLLKNYQATLKNCQVRLFDLTRSGTLDAAQLFAEHRRFGELCERRGRPGRRDFANLPAPERRLRIGYLSPDFRKHSVAHFFEPIISHHDHAAVEVYCYHCCPIHDEITARIKSAADRWIECSQLTDRELAAQIEADGIDILVDLAGYTTGSRVTSLVQKPAPIQITYLGYPATTGLRSIDYRLTDAVSDPPGLADAFFTERPLRLQQAMLAYRPGFGEGGLLSAEAPTLAAPPVLTQGHISFGSFNNLSKLNAGVLDAWAAILRAVPDATLTLKARALAEHGAYRDLHAEWSRRGIAPARLRLLARDEAPLEHLCRYGEIDIALDPFPYNGVTTSFEALWMGVPVLALAGTSPAARMGATIATHLGHPEWIAGSLQEYIDKAVALAADHTRLAQLRQGLRTELQASCLMDAKGFAQRLETAYRDAWRQWCAERAQGAPVSTPAIAAAGPVAATAPERVVIAGCARSCAPHLPAALANLERLASMFRESFTVVVENDSNDRTKPILEAWGSGRAGHTALCLDGLAEREPVRTRRLEFARNVYVQAILGDPCLAACEYLIVIDMDDAASRPINPDELYKALEFLRSRPQAAAVFPNQRGPYRDLWALRHPQKCPDDVWEEVCDRAQRLGVDDAAAFAATFQTRLFSLPVDAPPLEVDSAFGGFGLYKLAYVARNPNPYLGYKPKLLRQADGSLEVKRWQTCEHVHFHRGIRSLGGQLFVLPWLVNRDTADLAFPPSAWRRMLF